MILKFGKHAKKRVEDCPTEYLEWLVQNLVPEVPRWGAENAKMIEACNLVLKARAGGLVKAPKKPVAERKPSTATTIEHSDLSAPEPGSIGDLAEDLDIANQAIQRAALSLQRIKNKSNDEQPF